MKLKVKRLDKDAKLPERAHASDSGMDVFSIADYHIKAGAMVPVHTGIAIALPKPVDMPIYPNEPGVNFRQLVTWECQVRPKSGLSMKNGLTVLNTPGTIDNDYRGEIIVLLQNHSEHDFVLKKGQKVAQLVISPVVTPEIVVVNDLDETVRNDKGFGSTGLT